MARKILNLFLILLFGVTIVFTLAFSSKEVRDVKCTRIEIMYDDQSSISLGKEEIIHIIRSSPDSILGADIRNINAEIIENRLKENKTIKNAEVFKNVTGAGNNYEGILGVRVKFREPVFRVMSDNDSYYVDITGSQIPVSVNYSTNVPVATGKIDTGFAGKELLEFVNYINSDPFHKALIKQIHVQNEEEILLTPLVGNHLIELGGLDDYDEKMEHLKVFYQNVLVKNHWNTYKRISLKYHNQVIGIKK